MITKRHAALAPPRLLSVETYTRRLHDLRPFRGLLPDEHLELVGRVVPDLGPDVRVALASLRRRQYRRDRRVEAIHDRPRRPRRRQDTVPGCRFVLRHARFLDGRN